MNQHTTKKEKKRKVDVLFPSRLKWTKEERGAGPRPGTARRAQDGAPLGDPSRARSANCIANGYTPLAIAWNPPEPTSWHYTPQLLSRTTFQHPVVDSLPCSEGVIESLFPALEHQVGVVKRRVDIQVSGRGIRKRLGLMYKKSFIIHRLDVKPRKSC